MWFIGYKWNFTKNNENRRPEKRYNSVTIWDIFFKNLYDG